MDGLTTGTLAHSSVQDSSILLLFAIPPMIAEKLIATARPIVEHWFTDVTVHDVAAVKAMQIGEVRLWSLRKTGTWMCNLNSEIHENKHREPLASIIVGNPTLRDNSKAVYLVHKTAENDCEIIPTSYEELEYLV